MIKFGKIYSLEDRSSIDNLTRDFINNFGWGHDDLKDYKIDVINHTIPLKQEYMSISNWYHMLLKLINNGL